MFKIITFGEYLGEYCKGDGPEKEHKIEKTQYLNDVYEEINRAVSLNPDGNPPLDFSKKALFRYSLLRDLFFNIVNHHDENPNRKDLAKRIENLIGARRLAICGSIEESLKKPEQTDKSSLLIFRDAGVY